MTMLSPDRWRAINSYLDDALEMSDEERVAWLASLQDGNPTLAVDLRALLDEQRALAGERFLEGTPVPLPRGPEALAGQTIGTYTLLSPIGQGGMGSVWLAARSDGRFERRAAVKFLNIALGRGEERFRQEGILLARLSHPHIAQ